jgi:hypothetical protein
MSETATDATVGPELTAPRSHHRRRTTPWVIAAAVVLVGALVAIATSGLFPPTGSHRPGVASSAHPTGLYIVARRDLSSQTQVAATLGYAGALTVTVPSGASAQQLVQARRAVTADQLTLTADQQAASDQATSDSQAVTAGQTTVDAAQGTLTTDQGTLTADRLRQAQGCAGPGASSPACGQDDQQVSQDSQRVSQDQPQLTQARQQLAAAQTTATSDRHQGEAKITADETTLAADQATLTSLRATAVNPDGPYTAVPKVGDVIQEDQAVYSASGHPVPLLYGPVTAYRAFFVGMSDGADVGQLTRDLIALRDGTGLTPSDHYSAATATAVTRWQTALGLPATGEILLGQVVFEPGPIRITSITASVGAPVGSGDTGASGAGTNSAGGSGGGTVLAATSMARQVSIALDTAQQSEVKVGDKVTITLPNNQTTPGVISSVGTVATTPASSGPASGGSGSSAAPTITVLVSPTDPAATGTWDLAPVNVTITTGAVSNVLVVPVDALLAQSAGGYGVEVVDADGIHHLVSVTLGLFDDADGLVQVSGPDLVAGQRMVVPKL